MSQERPPPILYYHLPRPDPKPGPLAATFLCLPGILCWCLLAALWTHGKGRLPAGPCALLAFWPIAIASALASIIYYWKKPKPWYVIMSVMLNVIGLLFSLAMVLLFVSHVQF
jgi:hypothetical protein